MNDAKYIGLDAHQATISAAVRDSDGKLVLEAILETKAETRIQGIRRPNQCTIALKTAGVIQIRQRSCIRVQRGNHIGARRKILRHHPHRAEFERGRYRELSQNWHSFLPGQIETADTSLLTFRR